jgi:hypothetical protein
LSEDLISGHVKKWINAWNSKNINSILSLYGNNSVEFSSPKIKKLFLDYETNTITNKNDLKNTGKNYKIHLITHKNIMNYLIYWD